MRKEDKSEPVQDAADPLAYSAAEAAEVAAFSRNLINQALDRRERSGKKMGRRVLILKKDLEAHLKDLPPLGPKDTQ